VREDLGGLLVGSAFDLAGQAQTFRISQRVVGEVAGTDTQPAPTDESRGYAERAALNLAWYGASGAVFCSGGSAIVRHQGGGTPSSIASISDGRCPPVRRARAASMPACVK